jgi:hypothetical protein
MDEQTDTLNEPFERYIELAGASIQKGADDREYLEVYGVATSEALDSQGDIVDMDAVQKALPDYLKFGNIREMHKASAVGTITKTEIRDGKLHIWAKIVDRDAITKVREGVYKGFSIGGKALKAVWETMQDSGKRVRRVVDLLMNEISLVDRPSNPESLLLLFKRDDTEPASPWALDDEQVSVIGKATHERLNERTKPTRDEEVMPVSDGESESETKTDNDLEKAAAPGRILASLQELRNEAERNGEMYRVMCLNLAIKHFLRGTDMSDDDEEMEEYPMEPMERMDAALNDMQSVLSGDIAKAADYEKMRGYMKKMRAMIDEMEKMYSGDDDKKDEKSEQPGDVAKAEPAFTPDDLRAALADAVKPLAERIGKLEQQPVADGPVLHTSAADKRLPGQRPQGNNTDTIAELRKAMGETNDPQVRGRLQERLEIELCKGL